MSLLGMVFVQTSLMLYACSCNAFNKCKQDFDPLCRHLFISAFIYLFIFFNQGQHVSLAPVQKLEETLYEYQPPQVETYGPPVPDLESLGRLG